MHVPAFFSTTHISTYVFNTSVLMYLTYNLAGKKTTQKDTLGPKGMASQVPTNLRHVK